MNQPGKLPAADPAGERSLVERARGGDVAAFEQLYRDNVGSIHALCLRLVADRTQAEELTQDAFVRAWSRLETFDGRSRFRTWMHRIAVNEMLGQKRRDRRRFAALSLFREDDESTGRATQRHGPDTMLDIEAAVLELPERARHVFVLHAMLGHTHEEIAEILGTATGTSKAQLHRARKMLCERLKL